MATNKLFFHKLQSKFEKSLKDSGYIVTTLWQHAGDDFCLNGYIIHLPRQMEIDESVPPPLPPRTIYALMRSNPEPHTLVLGEIRHYEDAQEPLSLEEMEDRDSETLFQLSVYEEEGEIYQDDQISWYQVSQRIRGLMAGNWTLERILTKAVHDHLNGTPPQY